MVRPVPLLQVALRRDEYCRRMLRLDVVPPPAAGGSVSRCLRILAFGEIGRARERALLEAGALFFRARSLEEARAVALVQPFDAVLTEPTREGAFDLVHSLKDRPPLRVVDAADDTGVDTNAALLFLAYRETPVVILPLPSDTEYAVIVRPPDDASLEDERRLSVVTLLLRYDELRGPRRFDA